MRNKSVSAFEKPLEIVYGLNQTSPSKKTQTDKAFEANLKRHLIRGQAEKLANNISEFYK